MPFCDPLLEGFDSPCGHQLESGGSMGFIGFMGAIGFIGSMSVPEL
jgi:hypothetical protein